MHSSIYSFRLSIISILLSINLVACGGSGGASSNSSPASNPTSTNPTGSVDNPLGPILPGAPANTDLERSMAIAAGILARQQPDGSWLFDNEGKLTTLTDAYQGQAGILQFLCLLYQRNSDPILRRSIENGANWLKNQNIEQIGPSLFSGQAGVAYVYLTLADTLHSVEWRTLAIRIAEKIQHDQTQLSGPGDMISGHISSGLFFLKLYSVTQEQRWLLVARDIADQSLSKAVKTSNGLHFETDIGGGKRVTYPGFAHGSAGAGYFLLALSQQLQSSSDSAIRQMSSRYSQSAKEIAQWLRSIALKNNELINWYRRDPDQLSTLQNQWCHGAPGIGLFFTKLYEVSGDPADLQMAIEAAKTVTKLSHTGTSLCHGLTGNAQLYLRLYRLTGDASYLQQARTTADQLWASRNTQLHYPSWMGEDGSQRIHNASLMTGNAGRAYFFLQMDAPQQLAMPFLE
ncbi:lanthionine synthetase LanC family protein [Undibacterium danionis]|uniref:Lanthionine synthetase LanC family protein n=1 Tax=Undibacterium danionis TaxID=1812100 RepID=A0ABV6ID85_9BURK